MREAKRIPGEAALALAVLLNAVAVALMNKGDFGLSPFSSVPYVLHNVTGVLTFGVWNYLFQLFLIVLLMAAVRRFKKAYVFSFVVAVAFGYALDACNALAQKLPPLFWVRVCCYVAGFLILTFSIGLFNRCEMPVMAMDMFTRDISQTFSFPFKKVKTLFDISCLAASVILSFAVIRRIEGVGIGTVVGALITGRTAAVWCAWLDRHVRFYPHFFRFESKKTL